MVKYVTMKRITQILASVLFIVTVLTLYLAVDFVISNSTPHKQHGHRRTVTHDHGQYHPPDEIKISRKRSIPPQLVLPKEVDAHQVHPNHSRTHLNGSDQDRHSRKSRERGLPQARAKAGHFHKGKTGVKVNRLRPAGKGSHKHSGSNSTKIHSPHLVRKPVVDENHV